MSDDVVEIDVFLTKHIELFRNILSDIPDADMLPLPSISFATMYNIIYYAEYDIGQPIDVEDIGMETSSLIIITWVHDYFEYLSFNEIVDGILAADILNYKRLYDMAVVYFAMYLNDFCNRSPIFRCTNKHISPNNYMIGNDTERIYRTMEEMQYEEYGIVCFGMEYDEEEKFYLSDRKYDF